MRYLTWLVVAACITTAFAAGENDAFAARRAKWLTGYTKRPLKQGANPETWVDVERWCVAHACLAQNVRLDEANQYLAEVQWCSLWHGLVADTDVQVTDLLRTWYEFKDDARLRPPARAHLLALFGDWRVPNPDRNFRAAEEYEWPCAYTENHSLNILAAAYLLDDVLARDRAAHRALLAAFLRDRARWGWSEFHSPSYGVVTAKVLSLLADFAPDAPVATTARMLLDVLALEDATHCLSYWRGQPFARGYGSEVDNRRNSANELAMIWFGEPTGMNTLGGGTFAAHLLTSKYRPPALAVRLANDPAARGRCRQTQVATHGPAKLRIPIETWVTPVFTMASAQGFGSYYDGCFWTISFASAANRVLTGRYGPGRNLVQRDNVLITFGTVEWHGQFARKTEGALTIGSEDGTWIALLDLGDDARLLYVEEKTRVADEAAFRAAVAKLGAKFAAGVVTWTMPDGRACRMVNQRDGTFWRLDFAEEDGKRLQLDRNLLYDSPYLRSERDSLVILARDDQEGWRYDFRDPAAPRVEPAPAAPFPALPPDEVAGPLGLTFVRIPAGEFPLGSPASEGRARERPQRWVTTGAYYLSQTEISVGQYRQFLAANPAAAAPLPDWYTKDWGKTDAHPIAWVTWAEADAFCQWLTRQGPGRYRLPTEVEWEKAAKGFAHRAYPWGDAYDGAQAGSKNGVYLPVGTKPTDRSPFGALDMAGNVWEWCADAFTAYGEAPAAPPVAGAAPPTPPALRVVRGCGWNFDPDTFRCSYRSALAPTERSPHLGFRVVREAE